jgi:hypothetical protein
MTMRYDEWAAIGHANGWLGVRTQDGITSREGARSITLRAGSQRAMLLEMYWAEPLTDEEAGNLSGLSRNPKCGYWKRCSELRQAGYIRPTGEMRESVSGVSQQVCEITEAGRVALDSFSVAR